MISDKSGSGYHKDALLPFFDSATTPDLFHMYNGKPLLPSLCLQRVTVSISDREPFVLNANSLYPAVGHNQ